MSIASDQGHMLYLLARATNVKAIVEVGTYFAISTIYPACAARDNSGKGKVAGFEIVASQAQRALGHLQKAGVAEYAHIRVGDALKTLANIDGPVDLLLLDGFPTLALNILKLVEPKLRPEAKVLAADVNLFQLIYSRS